jgi:hypothetical protein
MKTLATILLAFVLLPAASATGQSVRAQFVHNSPDPAVDTVDVYVDSVLTIDDFAFQTATPYMDLPVGMHDMSLAPSSSTGAGETLVTIAVDLVEGKTYSIIAAGVLDPARFGPNPAGRSTALTLFTTDDAREVSEVPTEIRWRAFLGVPDLPAIDFVSGPTGQSVAFRNGAYGDFSDHVMPTPEVLVGVTRRTGPGTLISSNTRDFTPSVGQVLLGMPTGLYGTPERIQWMAVAADGTVDFGTDSTPLSRAQIVHASADPAAAVIDVWLDGGLYLNDFAFQTATPYLDLPVGSHEVVIADSSSVGLSDALIAPLRFTMASDSTHSIVFAGVLDPGTFSPNPDGRDIAFDAFVATGALESTPDSTEFAVRQFYGVHDLGESDWLVDSNTLWSDMHYGEFTDHTIGNAAQTYSTHLRGTGTIVTSDLYSARDDMSAFAGMALLGVLSGRFGGPTGIEIESFLVLPDGSTAVASDISSRHRAQIVHGSADPAVDTVDVYLDGGLLINDFAFGTARPFWNLPAEKHEVTIAASNSVGKVDAIATFTMDWKRDKTHSIVLAGVVDTTQWPANPDGRDVSLNLFMADDALESSPTPDEWTLRQFYAVTNMPPIDFWVDTWDHKAFESIRYGDFTDVVDPDWIGALVGSIRGAGSDRTDQVIHSTEQDWGPFKGNSVLEVYTGMMREHGFKQFYVTPDGQVGKSTVKTSIAVEDSDLEIPSEFAIHGNYPNPFNPATSIRFDLPSTAQVSVQVFDITGRMVIETSKATFAAGAGHAVRLNATTWGSGLYLYKVIARARTSSWIGTGRMVLVK